MIGLSLNCVNQEMHVPYCYDSGHGLLFMEAGTGAEMKFLETQPFLPTG
jgi:hypothetical protein